MVKSKFKKSLFYIKKYRTLSVAIFLFVAFGSLLEVFSVGLLFPILQGVMGSKNIFAGIPFLAGFDSGLAGWPSSDMLSVLLGAFLLAFTVRSVVFYLGNVMISKQRFLVTRDLQFEFFEKLMDAGISFYDSTKSGYIINSIHNETTRIGNFINCMLRIFAMSVRMAVNVVILIAISWKFTAVAFTVFLVLRVPLYLIIKNIKQIGISVNRAIADLNFIVLEAVNGIRLIRIHSAEEYEKKRFRRSAMHVYGLNYSNLKRSESIMPFTQIAFLGVFVILFIIVIKSSGVDLAKTLPFIVAYLYVAKNVLGDFTAFQDRRAEAASYIGSFDSYEDLVRKIDSTIDSAGDIVFTGLKNSIRFDDVSFGYSPDKKVLSGITFSIAKNRTTALVGHSGTGKTTLVYLLLAFYKISSGRILVDDLDLRSLDMKSWRSKIGFVSQDVFIFNASARENIAYGNPNATDDQVRAAAKTAEIDEYLSGLPNGYDTILGERGVKVSGGQRQRISIARALMQDPEILILDEATSHLDTQTERQIQDAIEKLAKDRTVLVIAHRLSTILAADNILVLSGGKIIESGTHSELMKSGMQYKNLYETQFQQNHVSL